jgi:hypothetical protein
MLVTEVGFINLKLDEVWRALSSCTGSYWRTLFFGVGGLLWYDFLRQILFGEFLCVRHNKSTAEAVVTDGEGSAPLKQKLAIGLGYLTEGPRLRVFENRVLRGIFGPEGNGATGN